MAVYFPVPVTPNGRQDGHQQHGHPQWPSPSAFSGLVTYQQHLPHPPYHSPSSHSQQVPIRPQSTGPQQPLTHHWQQQLIKYEASRSAAAPHHRARTSAFTMRNSTKSAIPITNPNLHKQQGSISDRTEGSADEPPREGTPSTSDHPSATTAPVTTSPPMLPGPTWTRAKDEAMWTTLDMGGMRLKNLATSLFKLTYLTTLYVNHNSLPRLNPQISQLRNLILLDLSSNQLTSLPPDLGMCTSLRELLLFDNLLESLPPQLGTLHQLVMIGLEGNPMQANYRAILQKDGTRALIAYLRDSGPVPAPPPERIWRFMPQAGKKEADPEDETFTLLSYNILCERAATPSMYGYTPSWALSWDFRKDLILHEISSYDADFLCLQEVDTAQYEEYFMPNLDKHGYDGIFSTKTRAKTMTGAQRKLVDGCAIFYKKEKYALIEHQLVEFNSASHFKENHQDDNKTNGTKSISDDMYNRVFTKDDISIIALLENRRTGSRLIIVNVHVHWNQEFRDVKLVQVAIMMEELEKAGRGFARLPPRLLDGSHDAPKVSVAANGNGISNGASLSEGSSDPETPELSPDASASVPPPRRFAPTYDDYTRIPTIVCGDFNSLPGSGVYDFLSNGHLSPTHADFMTYKYGRYTDTGEGGGLKHPYSLKSAYATVLGGSELPITNYTPSFKGSLDYIWFSNHSLGVDAVLGEVNEAYLEKVVGFPNAHFPSDHVCIVGEFRIVKPKRDGKEANGVTNMNARPSAFYNNGRGRK
ncbi:Glucose-repressible alcohol dehydrogenase transcriptional effector [Tulasnella sp. 330]|nr:Glucose-repressible alcohol dehydrogenase transcriptional effector [Tulasnella sp. 330]KAG8890423.1 Glucose-repressible alcohol dehydrogenase transcriptional effector [Tulasnella sp. 332]